MANDETKKRLDYLCEQWGPALQAMATNDETRAAALAKRLLSLELGEGITQENICAGQELARAYLAQQSELDRLRSANAELAGMLNRITGACGCPANAADREQCVLCCEIEAALARHDAGKGGGE